jgi:hypothetical protein
MDMGADYPTRAAKRPASGFRSGRASRRPRGMPVDRARARRRSVLRGARINDDIK